MNLRVAVLQIASIPSLRWFTPESILAHELDDNFFLFNQKLSEGTEIESSISAQKSMARYWPELTKQYEKLQNVYRKEFCNHVIEILNKLVQAEGDKKLDLIVLPEYSVPVFALKAIGSFSKKHHIAIVAGTHSVQAGELDSQQSSGTILHPYIDAISERIDVTKLKPACISICPVFDGVSEIPKLTFKQIHSQYELNPTIISTPLDEARGPIVLHTRNGMEYKLGIAICYEFLNRTGRNTVDSIALKEQVRNSLEDVDVIAIPAMTPKINQFVDAIKTIQNASWSPSVLLSNWALAGSSGIWARTKKGSTLLGETTSECSQSCSIANIQIGKREEGHPESDPKSYYFFPNSSQWEHFLSINNALTTWKVDKGHKELSGILGRKTMVPIFDNDISTVRDLPSFLMQNLEQLELDLKNRRSVAQEKTILLDADNSKALTAISEFSKEFSEYYYQDLQKSLTHAADFFQSHHANLINGGAKYGYAILNQQQTDSIGNRPLSEQLGLKNNLAETIKNIEDFLILEPEILNNKMNTVGKTWCLVLRVASLSSEDFAIAHEHRLYWVVSELLRQHSCIKSFEQTYWAFPYPTSTNMEVLLSFWFVADKMHGEIAKEIVIALDQSLPIYYIEPVKIFQGILGDKDEELCSPKDGNYTSRFEILRTSDSSFEGLNEASKILRTLESLGGNNRLRIQINKPHLDLRKKTSISEKLKNDVLAKTPVAHMFTSVQDLQELRSAQLSMKAEPRLFPTNNKSGDIRSFPTKIIFETSLPSERILPQTLALELAGPMGARAKKIENDSPMSIARRQHQRFPFEVDPDDCECNLNILSDKDLTYILRLPFGKLPSFKTRNRTDLSLPVSDLPREDEGLEIGLAELSTGSKAPFYLSNRARRQHIHIMGKTGSGKSHFLASMVLNDISMGAGLMLIDPHGDLVETVISHIPLERRRDVVLFDPSDRTKSPGLNIFDTDLSDSAARSLVVEEAVAIFIKLHGPQIFGPRIQNYFRGALHSLMDYRHQQNKPPTLVDLAHIFVDSDFLNKVRDASTSELSKVFWSEYSATAPREKAEIIPYIQAKFSPFIGNDIMRNSIGQSRTMFDLDDAIQNRKIILVNLSKGSVGGLNSSLLGMVIVAKLNWAMMRQSRLPPNARKTFGLYIDEFQNFASSSFSEMISEARKFGLSMVLVNQYFNQLKIQNPWIREDPDSLIDSIDGNIASRIYFRLSNQDSERMAKEMSVQKLKGLESNPIAQALRIQSEWSAIISTLKGKHRLNPFFIESSPFPESEMTKETLNALKRMAARNAKNIQELTSETAKNVLDKSE